MIAGDTPVLVHNCGEARFAVDGKGAATDLEGPGSPFPLNRVSGDAFRDTVADFLRSTGRTVVTDAQDRASLTFRTPFQPKGRVLDMRVNDADGNHLGYIETKWRGAGDDYEGSRQQQSDEWLRKTYGFVIDIVRGR